MWAVCLFLLFGITLQAFQAPNSPPVPAPAGLETPWQVQKIVADLIKDNEDLKPLLDRIDPQQWYSRKGAPSTYILQRQAAQQQLQDVITTSRLLAQKTDDLTLAIDEYFRLEALEVTARSLQEGAQKYADRQTASKMAQLIAQNFSNRERFRNYLRDLAVSMQQDFKIADVEAQRCRGMISKEPLLKPSGRKNKAKCK
jgi:hypothetical protein